MSNRVQELRDLMHTLCAAMDRQQRVSLLYLDAVAKGEGERATIIAELLEVNSSHMDTVQDAIVQVVNDPDFSLRSSMRACDSDEGLTGSS